MSRNTARCFDLLSLHKKCVCDYFVSSGCFIDVLTMFLFLGSGRNKEGAVQEWTGEDVGGVQGQSASL